MINLLVAFQEFINYAICSVLGFSSSFDSRSIYLFIIFFAGIKVFNVIRKKGINQRDIVFVFVLLLVHLLYYFTSFKYDYTVSNYKTYFVNAEMRFLVPIILGWSVAKEGERTVHSMFDFLPWFIILLTWGSMLAALNSSGKWWAGGYIDDESGFRYQNISYALAYATGFTVFYLLYQNINDNKKTRWINSILLLCLPFQWFGILISGGKGGFVTAIALTLVNVWIYFKEQQFGRKAIASMCGMCILALVLVPKIISIAANSKLSTSAFSRIIDFIATGNNTGRNKHYILAINSIKNAPILGHGIGSVPYETIQYSHNYFLDVCVEMGIIGLIVLICLFLKILFFMIKVMKIDYIYSIIILIFLCGFIRAMFSGYYLSCAPLYWAMGYALNKKKVGIMKWRNNNEYISSTN